MINTNNTRLDIYRQQGNTEQNKKSSKESQLNALVTKYQDRRLLPNDFIENFEMAIKDGVFKTSFGFNKEARVTNFLERVLDESKQQNDLDHLDQCGIYHPGQELLPVIIWTIA